MAVQWKEVTQRVQVDVRRRLLPKWRFDFSSKVTVLVRSEYEKSHGLCLACGFFFYYGGGGYDKLFEIELEELLKLVVVQLGEETSWKSWKSC
ncbi:hypothetical protein ACLB2K_053536 [Fragaria x ananassa]